MITNEKPHYVRDSGLIFIFHGLGALIYILIERKLASRNGSHISSIRTPDIVYQKLIMTHFEYQNWTARIKMSENMYIYCLVRPDFVNFQ